MDFLLALLCFIVLCIRASSSGTIPATDIKLMERETVTFYTDVAELHEGDLIRWWTGSQEIAEVTKQSMTIHDNKIKDKIELDNQTGSLTIKNIRTTDSGNYECNIKTGNTLSHKCFTVKVHAPLPVPVIIRNLSQCSSSSERPSCSKCVLLCSVMNVRDVSLSWYKGNSLLSSISVSDLNIRLSLPLEVEYQDTNTYRCVVNNPFRNQTQHLNINHVCQPCSGSQESSSTRLHVVAPSVVLILGLVVCWLMKRRMNNNMSNATREKLASKNSEVNSPTKTNNDHHHGDFK